MEKCNAGQEYSGTRKNILRLFAIILVCCTMVFISCRPHKDILPTVQRIQERGVLLVGTTGDYRPLTFREADSTYWGFEIDMAEEMARRLGVGLQFVLKTAYEIILIPVVVPAIRQLKKYEGVEDKEQDTNHSIFDVFRRGVQQ